MSHRLQMLIEQGFLFHAQGNLNQAVHYFEEAVREAENLYGVHHPEYARNLNNLAHIYSLIGDYGKSESLYFQTLAIKEQTTGKNNADYAISLNNLAHMYLKMRNYGKTEQAFRQSLEIRARVLEEAHPDYVGSLFSLGSFYNKIKNYDKAEPLFCQALNIYEKIVNKGYANRTIYLEYTDCFNNLAGIYKEARKFDKAEPLYLKSLEILKEFVGQNNDFYAACLNNLADMYLKKDEYSKAESLFLQTLAIKEKLGRKENLAYATSLSNLAEVYRNISEYGKAESLFLQAFEIINRIVEKEHPVYISCLGNLALLYKEMGKYGKAETLYRQGLDISDSVFGRESREYTSCLHNLAMLYDAVGEYPKAESLLNQASMIQEKIFGTESPEYALNLTNQASLHVSRDEYDKAIFLLNQALEIQERTLGKKHRDYAHSFHNLARLHMNKGNYAIAEPLLCQALVIYESALGKEHPEYVACLDNLANLYISMKECAKAEHLFCQVLNMRENKLGKAHPDYATSLNNLAGVYTLNGKYDEAKDFYFQALKVHEKALGKNHPHYAAVLRNSALLKVLTRKFPEALETMLEVSRIDDHMITQMTSISDEKRIQGYIRNFQLDYFTLLSIYSQYYPELMKYTSSVFDVILRRKALTLEIAAIRRDNLFANKNQHLKNKFDDLKYTRMKMARLLSESTEKLSSEQYQERIQALEQQIEILEKELAVHIPQVELQKKLENAEYKAIACLLPEDTVLIEFVWYKPVDLEKEKLGFLLPHYLAFVLSSHVEEGIQMIDLGDASEIDELIKEYRREIIEEGERNIVVGPLNKESMEQDVPIGNVLYKKLLQPILTKIGDTKKLIISPDSNITLLPFEVLPQPNDRYAIEDFEILYVDSCRDLLRFQYHTQAQSRPLILVDPNFDLADSIGPNSDSFKFKISSEFAKMIKNRIRIPIPRLKGTREEGESIKHLFKNDVDIWIGKDVLDRDVKRIQGPQILHIATHGVFIPKKNESHFTKEEYENFLEKFPTAREVLETFLVTNDEGYICIDVHKISYNQKKKLGKEVFDEIMRQAQKNEQALEMSTELATYGFFTPKEEVDVVEVGLAKRLVSLDKCYENPLLRSWLALAGMNNFFQGKALPENAEDGILTALDVSGIDLIGTDFVVLSACETGLGEVQAGEGVYGLRRAFTLAGAKSIIISLWSVPDEETKKLMVNFYTKMLQGQGMEKANALREAQREIISELRSKGKPTSPYLWGAFVYVGSPGNMGELCEKKLKLQPVEPINTESRENLLEKSVREYFVEDALNKITFKKESFSTDSPKATTDVNFLKNLLNSHPQSSCKIQTKTNKIEEKFCRKCGGDERSIFWQYILLFIFAGVFAILVVLPFFSVWLLFISVPLGILVVLAGLFMIFSLMIEKSVITACPKCGRRFNPYL